jgi:uncharacterized protein (TIGR00369 family)
MSAHGHDSELLAVTETEPRAEGTSAANGWGPRRSKQVSWHDAVAAARLGMQLSGREFLQGIIDGRLPPPPMAELFNAQLVSVADGEAVFRCTADESAYNPIGMVHGGWLCMLMDSAAGCAVHTTLPAGAGYSSIELKVSFLKAIRADTGTIEVTGRALRVGGRVAFAEAHARDREGELVGHATSSIAVLRS